MVGACILRRQEQACPHGSVLTADILFGFIRIARLIQARDLRIYEVGIDIALKIVFTKYAVRACYSHAPRRIGFYFNH